jgi:hypothetical protein
MQKNEHNQEQDRDNCEGATYAVNKSLSIAAAKSGVVCSSESDKVADTS